MTLENIKGEQKEELTNEVNGQTKLNYISEDIVAETVTISKPLTCQDTVTASSTLTATGEITANGNLKINSKLVEVDENVSTTLGVVSAPLYPVQRMIMGDATIINTIGAGVGAEQKAGFNYNQVITVKSANSASLSFNDTGNLVLNRGLLTIKGEDMFVRFRWDYEHNKWREEYRSNPRNLFSIQLQTSNLQSTSNYDQHLTLHDNGWTIGSVMCGNPGFLECAILQTDEDHYTHPYTGTVTVKTYIGGSLIQTDNFIATQATRVTNQGVSDTGATRITPYYSITYPNTAKYVNGDIIEVTVNVFTTNWTDGAEASIIIHGVTDY